MQLIISEKPKVAEKIAQALGKATRKAVGGVAYYEIPGRGVVVAPAVGHLFSLKQKKPGSGYPVFEVGWVPSSESNKASAFTKKYLDLLKKLAAKSDEVVNACDWDVEGSTIGGNIIEFLAKGKKAKRMFFSTLTSEDLLEAYENLKPLDVSTVAAGQARHTLDWLWGINISRGLMSAIRKAGVFRIMSMGRVQGPALALLAKRENEIRAFVAKLYWQLYALAKGVQFLHERDRFFDKTEGETALKSSSKNSTVAKVDSKKFKQLPPFPFDLTSLQIEAYGTIGFAPTKTLQLAQELYEAAVISYPRTSSQKLPSKLNHEKIMKQLEAQKGLGAFAKQLRQEKRLAPHEGPKSDPAHPAIHPTGLMPEGSKDALRLYELIARRYLASFSKPALRERVNVSLKSGSEIYRAEGISTSEKGWFEVYAPFLRVKEKELPPFSEGETVLVEKFDLVEKLTQAPPRYSEASIIKALEQEDLGTKATRAEIVKTLFDRDYVSGKSLQVSPLGLRVFEAMEKHVPEIISPELTRHFEKEVEEIQEEKKSKAEVLEEGITILGKILAGFKKDEVEIGSELLSAVNATQRAASELGVCNKCGTGQIVLRRGKFGIFAACNRYPECQNPFSIPKNGLIKPTGKACQFCKTPIILVIRKGKRPFEMCLTANCESKKDWKNWGKTEWKAKPVEGKGEKPA
ncbi:TPA: DNA topoisomerase I [Candidatus Micrarchaeota archaeon]|nr:DNA topoisomerase I [Candidatus Micrarchaeota archaeon]